MVPNRLRSANSRSQVVPHQVPVGFSHPRQNQFEWEQICQIRYNKLYYQIILFSPTDNPNLNSSSKTKLQNRQKQSKFAHSSKMPHAKKLKQKQQRLAKRHPLNAPTGAQINHFPTFNFKNLTDQTFLAGPFKNFLFNNRSSSNSSPFRISHRK